MIMYGKRLGYLVCQPMKVCLEARVDRDAWMSGLPREGVRDRCTNVENSIKPTFLTFQLFLLALPPYKDREEEHGEISLLIGCESGDRSHYCPFEIYSK